MNQGRMHTGPHSVRAWDCAGMGTGRGFLAPRGATALSQSCLSESQPHPPFGGRACETAEPGPT